MLPVVLLALAAAGCLLVWWCFGPWLQDRPRRGETAGVGQPAVTNEAAVVPGREPLPRQSPAEESHVARPKTISEVIGKAKQTMGRLVRVYPDNPGAHELMARIHFYLGDRTAASESWNRCLQLDPGCADAYEGLGRVAAMKGDYEKAADLFRKAMLLSPRLSEAACQLGDVLLKLGRMAEAIEALEENIQSNPESASSFLLLGQAHLQLKQYEKAKASYEAAIRLQPDLSRAYFGLASALTRLGRHEASREYFQRFRQLRASESKVPAGMTPQALDFDATCANFSVAYTLGGEIYRAAGDPRHAEQLWQRAAALNPRNQLCRVSLARLYQQTLRWGEAADLYEELTALQPDNPNSYWQLGVLRARLKQFRAAESAFQKLIEVAPENPRGNAGLAEVYLQSNRRLAEAERLAREAVRLAPTAPYYLLVSRVCAKRADRAGALAAVDEAIKRDPDNAGFRAWKLQLRNQRARP